MKATFKWEDPFMLSEQLTEDERAIVEAAHTFCQEKLQTRVLMTSSRSEPEQVKTSFHNGANGFLVKPVDLERLKKRLRELALIPSE